MEAKKNKKRTINKSKKKVTKKITKNIIIGDLLSTYPESAEVLLSHGFHCIGCTVSPYETLEQGAAVHGIQLTPLLKDLNGALKK